MVREDLCRLLSLPCRLLWAVFFIHIYSEKRGLLMVCDTEQGDKESESSCLLDRNTYSYARIRRLQEEWHISLRALTDACPTEGVPASSLCGLH